MSDGGAEWPFEAMLEEFRALGGIAENFRLGEGAAGRGLFAIDPEKPAVLQTPPNLITPAKDVRFEDGRLMIADESELGAAERDFVVRYEAAYSWGAGGRESSMALLDGLDRLPDEIRQSLRHKLSVGTLLDRGDLGERAQQRFLDSRTIIWRGEPAVMPVADLANHRSGAPSFRVSEDGVRIEGRYPDEIQVHYSGMLDPFGAFLSWGFASDEPAAFSLPLVIERSDLTVQVRRDLTAIEHTGDFPAPTVTRHGNELTLSHLKIGSARAPRDPRGLFNALIQKHTGNRRDDLFELICHHNRMAFLDLLEALGERTDDASVLLRAMCVKQLRAMSFALGSRDF